MPAIMQPMNWDDLKVVLAVSRAGTLAGAARILRVDATTVGRRVASIEDALGVRLFDRLSNGYAPTDVGHRAIERAETVEREMQSLVNEIEGTDQRIDGHVRLTGLDAIFDQLIIPRLPRLLDRHPGLEITFSSNLDFVDLSRREADVALRSREPQHPDSVGRKLGRLAQAAYAATGFEPGDRPPLIGLPREYEGSAFSRLLLHHSRTGTLRHAPIPRDTFAASSRPVSASACSTVSRGTATQGSPASWQTLSGPRPRGQRYTWSWPKRRGCARSRIFCRMCSPRRRTCWPETVLLSVCDLTKGSRMPRFPSVTRVSYAGFC